MNKRPRWWPTVSLNLKVWQRRVVFASVIGVAALALWWPSLRGAAPAGPPTQLSLLVPDDALEDDVHVQAWQQAAAETGFALRVLSASQLMRQRHPPQTLVLIVPDGVHTRMNDALVAHLQHLVHAGARLMLVHDAGVATMDGRYHPRQSRLSSLVGVRYALYGELGPRMLGEQVALIDAAAVALLQLPPGKLMRAGSDSPLTSAQPVPAAAEDLAVVSYHYGRLGYMTFKTAGDYTGRRLMHGAGGNLIAGVHRAGAGEVLFVNLPLSFLKLRTDGFFLHAFLRFFAQDMVGLPQLAPMANAQGALIMNWHIDSAAAVPAMEKLRTVGAFEQGPYSVHLTAGPDVDVPGDGLGMDLARNATMRAWVQFFAARGDEVGSHGGWIHNEFGRRVDSQPREQSAALIHRNTLVVSQASGKPVREYSAPNGNHPAWITAWLRERGVLAYYFTGDIGMPPTRSFQDGQQGLRNAWAFPVLSFGKYAAFEEAAAHQVPETEVAAWLKDVADFCASTRTVRLMYFHPPGVANYRNAFADWMQHTKVLLANGSLRWTTMAQHADFSNRRLKTTWSVQADGGTNHSTNNSGNNNSNSSTRGQLRLQAMNPESLDSIGWLLPTTRYAQPRVLEGPGSVVRDGPYWRVIAGKTMHLVVSTALLEPAMDNTKTGTPQP
jgi:hypothetical protein